MKATDMRRIQSGGCPPANRVRATLLIAVALGGVMAEASATTRGESTLAMQEPSSPPGEGWEVISRTLDGVPLTPSAPTSAAAASGKSPSAPSSSDGWQTLASAPAAPNSIEKFASNAAGTEPSLSSTAAGTTQAPQIVVAAPPEAPFELSQGKSIEAQLQAWAKRAGWAISWKTPDDWVVPHNSAYGTDFEGAIQQVLAQLTENGADVRADIWKGNRSVVVDKSGADE